MFKKLIVATTISLMVSLTAISAEIPVDAKLDYNQGIDFYKLGMYERAIESFRSAIRTYPDYIDAYYNLGVVLEYLKNYSEAINVFKQIYLRNPNDYEVIYKLALKSYTGIAFTTTSLSLTLITLPILSITVSDWSIFFLIFPAAKRKNQEQNFLRSVT